jgi:hypothetical protein
VSKPSDLIPVLCKLEQALWITAEWKTSVDVSPQRWLYTVPLQIEANITEGFSPHRAEYAARRALEQSGTTKIGVPGNAQSNCC